MNSNYRYNQYTGVYTLSSKDNAFAQMVINTNTYVVPINWYDNFKLNKICKVTI